jgi:hypothetical protein
MSVVVLTFKEEGADDGRPFGPVVVIQAQGEDAEAAAAAGVPFAYRPEQADEVGWKSYRKALVIAEEHGVPLTQW